MLEVFFPEFLSKWKIQEFFVGVFKDSPIIAPSVQ